MKTMKALLVSAVLSAFLYPISVQAGQNVLNLTDRKIPQGVLKQISQGKQVDIPGSRSRGRNWGTSLTVVELRGKTNHFGRDMTTGAYIDYWATIPGVRVWISEYPYTRDLGIRTDDTGWWTMYVIKFEGVDLEFSFVYEKDGWITTKSNAITVTDEDDTDLAIQYIDPLYYEYAVKPYVQAVWLGPVPFLNAMVVTVGKSWASMHDGRLPHGDPGATAIASPALGIGPIYFNGRLAGGLGWMQVVQQLQPRQENECREHQKEGEAYRVFAQRAGLFHGGDSA